MGVTVFGAQIAAPGARARIGFLSMIEVSARRLGKALRISLVLAAAWSPAIPSLARAQNPDAAGGACGVTLSAPIFSKWAALGGAQGRLGCPTAPDGDPAASPQGTAARQAIFRSGTILLHASGPHAGEAFAIWGCLFRLYFQYGGPSGWLGLPLADAVNTPDGQRQTFEGGEMRYLRAPDTCAAERLGAPPPRL